MSTVLEEPVAGAFKVVPTGDECGACHRWPSFDVVGPDGVAEPVSFDVKEDAEDYAETLSRVFEEGRQSGPLAGPWLVWSIEHGSWWGPDRGGYYSTVVHAGRYSYADARKICDRPNYRGGSALAGTGIPSEVMVPSPEMLAGVPSIAEGTVQ